MADPSDGSFNLKHRLVGATALILVAVILLPRVLTGADAISVRSHVNVSRAVPQIQPQVFSEISPSDSDTVESLTRTKLEILDDPVVARFEAVRENAQSSDFHEAHVGTDHIAQMSLASDPSVSESIVTGWIVQVGIFQQPENARKLIAELKEDRIDAKADIIEMDGRQATRIWLGPFSARLEATREGNKAMMRTNSKPIIQEWP